MQKLQPEGGYDPIAPADPRYNSRLPGVAVMKELYPNTNLPNLSSDRTYLKKP